MAVRGLEEESRRSDELPVLEGHRGYGHLARHNSLTAFRLAQADPSVAWVEFDVRKTRDGVLVVTHGPDGDTAQKPSRTGATRDPMGSDSDSQVSDLELEKEVLNERNSEEIGIENQSWTAVQNRLRIPAPHPDRKLCENHLEALKLCDALESGDFSSTTADTSIFPRSSSLVRLVGEQSTVPTLEQVLDVCVLVGKTGRSHPLLLNVEIKTADIVAETMQELETAFLKVVGNGDREQAMQLLVERVKISSFLVSALVEVHEKWPSVPTGLILNPGREVPFDPAESQASTEVSKGYRLREIRCELIPTKSSPTVSAVPIEVKQVFVDHPDKQLWFYRAPTPPNFLEALRPGLDWAHFCAEVVCKEEVDLCRVKGIKTMAWYPGVTRIAHENQEQLRRLKEQVGVDSVCSNYPNFWWGPECASWK